MDYVEINQAVEDIGFSYWMFTEAMRGVVSNYMLNTEPRAPVNRYRAEVQVGLLANHQAALLRNKAAQALQTSAQALSVAHGAAVGDLIEVATGELDDFISAHVARDYSAAQRMVLRAGLVPGSLKVHDIEFASRDAAGRRWGSGLAVKTAVRQQLVLLHADAVYVAGAADGKTDFTLKHPERDDRVFSLDEYAAIRAELHPNTSAWIE